MPESELKIRHVSYPIHNKNDAFWFNFEEGFGRAAGWAVVIGIAFFAMNYFGENSDASGVTSQHSE